MQQVEVIMLAGAFLWLSLVVGLIRQRQLSEGYALLWLFSAVILVFLALRRSLLDLLAHILGIYYPPAALFVIAFGFVLLLLLQQSVLICALERRIRKQAQYVALLSIQLEQLNEQCLGPNPQVSEDEE